MASTVHIGLGEKTLQQPHDRVNFGGLCFACSVFLSRASKGFSLTSVVPFIAHRSRCILVHTHLLGSC